MTGEVAWAKHNLSLHCLSLFARQANELTENDISPYAENKEELLNIFRKSDKRLFAPPGLEGTFLLPGLRWWCGMGWCSSRSR
ncbi:MAG: hypothetical protein WDO71_18955 [Bacteroidota bacterium]